MTDLPQRNFLELSVEKDVSDGFLTIGRRELAAPLIRSGSITVEGAKTQDGEKCFKIDLVSGLFDKLDRPAVRAESGAIPYDGSALYLVIKKCRDIWLNAVINHHKTVVAPEGGQIPLYFFEKATENPVDQDTFNAIAAELAKAGNRLFAALFERNQGTPLDDVAKKLRHAARSSECVFTVNSHDFHIPWGMLYTHPDPDEPLKNDGSNFEPGGFWGYQHIVEQFTKNHTLTSWLGPVLQKVRFGAALHENLDELLDVSCVEQHRHFTEMADSRLDYAEWTTKEAIGLALSTHPFDQQIVYFLCHAEGAGTQTDSQLVPPALEVTDGKIDITDIRDWIAQRFGENRPLVFINACCGGQLDTLLYNNFTFATEFLDRGAACVIGPQIEVPAIFAGEYGRRFFEAFVADDRKATKAGPLMRELNREFWKRRNPLGLVYSLYASADCSINWREYGEATT